MPSLERQLPEGLDCDSNIEEKTSSFYFNSSLDNFTYVFGKNWVEIPEL